MNPSKEPSKDPQAVQNTPQESSDPPRDQLTPREVADRTGFSYHAILRAIKRGDLEAFEPVAGRLRIEYEEYERWRKAPRQSRPSSSPPPSRRRRRSSGKEGFRGELDRIEEEAA